MIFNKIKRRIEKFWLGRKLPKGELEDFDKMIGTPFRDFFQQYRIIQVYEKHFCSSLRAKKIEKEIMSLLNELFLIDADKKTTKTMAIVRYSALAKELHIFCLNRNFDKGVLWAYGFAEPQKVVSVLNPAVIRDKGLPSDIKRIVRAIQKECIAQIIRNPSLLLKGKIKLW